MKRIFHKKVYTLLLGLTCVIAFQTPVVASYADLQGEDFKLDFSWIPTPLAAAQALWNSSIMKKGIKYVRHAISTTRNTAQAVQQGSTQKYEEAKRYATIGVTLARYVGPEIWPSSQRKLKEGGEIAKKATATAIGDGMEFGGYAWCRFLIGMSKAAFPQKVRQQISIAAEEKGAVGVTQLLTDAAATKITERVTQNAIDPMFSRFMGEMKKLEPKYEEIKQMASTVMEGAKKLEAKYERIESFVHESKSFLLKSGLLAAGTIVGAIATYYGSKYLWNELQQYLHKPRVTYKLTKFGEIMRSAGTKNIVFSEDVAKRLETIVDTTALINQKIEEGDTEIAYKNVLLYGPAGSGKRLFAQQLAKSVGIDFIEVEASSITQLKEDDKVAALEDFFTNVAQKGDAKIIFIDDADLLVAFKEKDKEKDSECRLTRTMSTFIKHTKNPSPKYMLLLGIATDEEPTLCKGISDVIRDVVQIKRPELAQRIKILELYRDELFGSTDVSEACAQSALKCLNKETIEQIATRLEGFCANGLCNLIKNIKLYSSLPSQGKVTKATVDSAVDELLEIQKRVPA